MKSISRAHIPLTVLAKSDTVSWIISVQSLLITVPARSKSPGHQTSLEMFLKYTFTCTCWNTEKIVDINMQRYQKDDIKDVKHLCAVPADDSPCQYQVAWSSDLAWNVSGIYIYMYMLKHRKNCRHKYFKISKIWYQKCKNIYVQSLLMKDHQVAWSLDLSWKFSIQSCPLSFVINVHDLRNIGDKTFTCIYTFMYNYI